MEEASAPVSSSVTAAERLLAPLVLVYRSILSANSIGMDMHSRRLVTGPLDTARRAGGLL